jgi:hypothetical protein
MTINYSIDFNEDDIAPDYEASSWDELSAELDIPVSELKQAYVNDSSLHVNGNEVKITSVYK